MYKYLLISLLFTSCGKLEKENCENNNLLSECTIEDEEESDNTEQSEENIEKNTWQAIEIPEDVCVSRLLGVNENGIAIFHCNISPYNTISIYDTNTKNWSNIKIPNIQLVDPYIHGDYSLLHIDNDHFVISALTGERNTYYAKYNFDTESWKDNKDEINNNEQFRYPFVYTENKAVGWSGQEFSAQFEALTFEPNIETVIEKQLDFEGGTTFSYKAHEGKILFWGGIKHVENPEDPSDQIPSYNNDGYLFDLTTEEFVTLPTENAPSPRFSAQLFLNNEYTVVYGGKFRTREGYDTITTNYANGGYLYDNKWYSISEENKHNSVAPEILMKDNFLYFYGGHDDFSSHSVINRGSNVSKFSRLNLKTNTWESLSVENAFYERNYNFNGGQYKAYKNNIVSFDGKKGAIYDIEKDSWTQIKENPALYSTNSTGISKTTLFVTGVKQNEDPVFFIYNF